MKILSKALLNHSGLYLFKTPETVDSYMPVIRTLGPQGRSSLDPCTWIAPSLLFCMEDYLNSQISFVIFFICENIHNQPVILPKS